VLAALVMPLGSTGAFASDAEGCHGTLASQGVDRVQIDTDRPPDQHATADNPFEVDLDGTVSWLGEAQDVITDGTWSLSALGLPLLSGDAVNPEGTRIREGLLDLTTLPAYATWLAGGQMIIPVAGSFTGTGGSCIVSGYVQINRSPTSAPLFFVAVALLLAGVLVFVGVARRTRVLPPADFLPAGYEDAEFGVEKQRHPFFAFGGGVLVGIGIVLLLFVFGVVPVSWGWLIGAALVFGLLGVVGAYVVPARQAEAA
jgi:hypothetical protein